MSNFPVPDVDEDHLPDLRGKKFDVPPPVSGILPLLIFPRLIILGRHVFPALFPPALAALFPPALAAFDVAFSV